MSAGKRDPGSWGLIDRLGLRQEITELVRQELLRGLDRLDQGDEFMSTRAAAQLAGVAQGTVRRWIREGRLTAHHAGRVLRVKRADVERLMANGTREKHEPMSPEELAARDFSDD